MPTLPPADFLEQAYDDAASAIGSGNVIASGLSQHEKELLDIVLQYSEQAKAVLTVVITSPVYKSLHPEQDIRKHQASIADGYSGRSFDSRYITPFMKRHKFPSMAESGWLTRALEQKVPYNKDYPGAITPKVLKPTFLEVLSNVEQGADCTAYLNYLLQGLILKRNQQQIELARPIELSIAAIIDVLEKHFNNRYTAEGASRLPVLAIYAAYECLINELKRFENKKLLSIESHTSSDRSSGRIGDIETVDERERAFEAVEVKFGIAITLQLVQDAFAKFQITPVKRYYILSTANSNSIEMEKINEEVRRIKNVHGCQVIVNGIMPTLKYYLRLLDNPFEFVNNYVRLLENDGALKYEHKERWNKIIQEMR